MNTLFFKYWLHHLTKKNKVKKGSNEATYQVVLAEQDHDIGGRTVNESSPT